MKKDLLILSALTAAALQLGCAPPMKLAPTQDRSCQGNGTCFVDVYASVAADQSCEVRPQYKNVLIEAGAKPKVVWRIEPTDPHDPFDYQFALAPAASPPVYGVGIVGNDPALDFEDPGLDNGNAKRFRWTSVHGRAKGFDYVLNVQRKPHSGPGAWVPCAMVDPRIVNQ